MLTIVNGALAARELVALQPLDFHRLHIVQWQGAAHVRREEANTAAGLQLLRLKLASRAIGHAAIRIKEARVRIIVPGVHLTQLGQIVGASVDVEDAR